MAVRGGGLFVWPKSQAYQNRPHPISNHLLSLDKTRILSFEAQKRLIMTYPKILFSAQHWWWSKSSDSGDGSD